MKRIVRALVAFGLARFPVRLKEAVRALLPVPAKRWLGAAAMSGAARDTATVTVADGRVFKVIEDRVFLRVLYERDYEPALSAVARGLLRRDDNVVDVGANYGWYATLFALRVGGGKVVCYEPAQHAFEALRENIRLNGLEARIDARNVATGDRNGTAALEMGSDSNSALAHIVPEPSDHGLTVPIVRLADDLRSLRGRLAYIKVDVEGYEHATLLGATELLEVENQPILQLELNDSALELQGGSRAELLGLLTSLGYEFWQVVSNGGLERAEATRCSDVFCAGRGAYAGRLVSGAAL